MPIGLAVFVLYLYFFAGFKNIANALSGVNPVQYAVFYSLAIGAVFLGNFFWFVSWRNVLGVLNVKISLKNAFLYYWTGYFLDLVIPAETVGGELARLYLVHKETNHDYGVVAAGGITNRIVAYLIVVTGLFLSAGLLFLKANIPAAILTVFILILIGATAYLGVLLYLALSKQAAGKMVSLGLRILRVLRPKKYRSRELSPEVKESLARFYSGFKIFRENPRHLVKPFVYLTVSWLFNLAQYILVFYALGLRSEPFAFFIIIYFIAGSLTDVAASLSVGSLDILLATIFVFYGLNPALSGITAALVRSVTFWAPLIIGYVIVQAYGVKRLLAPNPAKDAKLSTENLTIEQIEAETKKEESAQKM